MKSFKVRLEQAGRRVDQVLSELIPEHSRSRLQKCIQSGQVLVDERTVTPKSKVYGGETISITLAELYDEVDCRPQKIPLSVIYEDETIVVIDKQSNLVVHPAAGNWDGTLLNGILNKWPDNVKLPRGGIVHRLDKDTTGLIVVARTIQSQTSLVRQLQLREVTRKYLALVYGQFTANQTIDKPIGRHPRNRKLMSVNANGKPAVTHITAREIGKNWSLLECSLESGRTHQIRVHLASTGFPIIGDQTYSATNKQKGEIGVVGTINRQALHAVKLEIIHPLLEKPMQWEIDPPEDFRDTLEYLRAKY